MNFICPVCGMPVVISDPYDDLDHAWGDYFIHKETGKNIWMEHGDDLDDRHSFVNELLDGLSCNILAFEGDPPINNFGDTE